MRTSKELSLDEAALYAREHHLVGDYFALSSDVREDLYALKRRTRWRHSYASVASGRSDLYGFHQALKRALRRHSKRSIAGRDPERRKVRRALSRSEQAFVSHKIPILLREGYPPRQAKAIAISMAQRKNKRRSHR